MSLWGDIGSIVLSVATISSAIFSSQANTEAAEAAAEAERARIEAIREGDRLAQERFERIQEETAPARLFLRRTVAGVHGLTPFQMQQLEDLRRRTKQFLAASGLRGAGRSTVAAMRAVESDFVNRALEANRGRADIAASQLAGAGFNAARSSAALESMTGRAAGEGVLRSGLFGAQAGIENTRLRGEALGDIASLILTEAKGRESRYAEELDKRRRSEEVETI